MVLSMELVIFLPIRSFREANFVLYCQALHELIPYFFSNNNTNYACWLPIHLRDMLTLESSHPELHKEFKAGNFVVHKTSRQFSAMALDQAHEQTNAFIKADGRAIGLTEDPSALRVEESDLKVLERFVILMYDRSSTAGTVDEARLDMFARKQRAYEAIPPTRGALLQHTKRAAYQAGCVWGQATQCQPQPENPAEWGWQKSGEAWQVLWTTNSPLAKSCQQLTKCGCKAGCQGSCKCYKLGLPCTALCTCKCEV